jgi:hypothetical protein
MLRGVPHCILWGVALLRLQNLPHSSASSPAHDGHDERNTPPLEVIDHLDCAESPVEIEASDADVELLKPVHEAASHPPSSEAAWAL